MKLLDRLARRVSSADSLPAPVLAKKTSIGLSELYDTVESALASRDIDRARALAASVCQNHPNDLLGNALLARAHLESHEWDQACARLDLALTLDPEDESLYAALGSSHRAAGRNREAARALASAVALDPDDSDSLNSLNQLRESEPAGPRRAPGPSVAEVRRLRVEQDFEGALDAAEAGLSSQPGNLHLTLLRAEMLWRLGLTADAERACRNVLARHPKVLKPRLILGQILSDDPEREAQGDELIRLAQADDLAGVVSRRLFSETEYSLPALSLDLMVEVPRELLGATPTEDLMPNVAERSVPADEKGRLAPEVDLFLESFDDESFETEIATRPDQPIDDPKVGALSPTLGKLARPKLVGICVRDAIIERYGLEGLDRLDRRLRAVRRELDLIGVTFDVAFVDDAASMSSFGGIPIASRGAEDFRTTINDLARLAFETGSDTASQHDGALVIIGGDDVVPYFRIANPADDDDAEVLTDNPYGTRLGGSILLPDIPVGRLVDGYAGTLSLLLRQLDNLVEARREALIQPVGRGLLGAGRVALNAIGIGKYRSSALACVAADRVTTAALVVSAVAPGGLVQSCPPADPRAFDLRWLGEHRSLFIDATGTTDGERWYGQPVQNPETGTWESPVAFGADNLAQAHLRSPVVFTSAGYATRFAAGRPGGSLATRFLTEGAAALVGSSASTYGASKTPLAGADLLANLFWQHLQKGKPVADALRLARRSFAKVELERQGFLDGDDQKTLLEFGVYGDPLFRLFEASNGATDPATDTLVEAGDCLCKMSTTDSTAAAIDRRLVREATQFVTAVHPELADGAIRVQHRVACQGQCDRLLHPGPAYIPTAEVAEARFVSARSDVGVAGSPGTSIVRLARATVDDEGQVVKLVISR